MIDDDELQEIFDEYDSEGTTRTMYTIRDRCSLFSLLPFIYIDPL